MGASFYELKGEIKNMIRKEFTYEDYDGNQQTITAYFHLNKNDAIDLDRKFSKEGGLVEYLKSLLKLAKEDPEAAPDDSFIRFVRLLVTKSYGVRPKNDPSLFLKEDEDGRPLVQKFKGTPAYDDFVYDLLTGKEDLGEFTNGIMPKIDSEQRAKAEQMLEEEGLKPVLREV